MITHSSTIAQIYFQLNDLAACSEKKLQLKRPPLPNEILSKICKHLSIKDQINLSETCWHAKSITDYTLYVKAVEFGYSFSIPDIDTPKQYLATLFKIVKILEKKHLIQKSVVHFITKEKRYFNTFHWTSKKMDCERTLQNISEFELKDFAELYKSYGLHEIKNIQFLHRFMCKQRPISIVKTSLDVKVRVYLRDALFSAVSKLDPLLAKYLISQGADPNFPYVDGDNLLNYFAKYGTPEQVTFLLNFNAQVNARGFDGETALRIATRRNNFEIVKILLENGADPNIACHCGTWTPIHRAAARGNMEILELLLTYNADINCKGRDGSTPLDQAKKNKQNKAIALLERNGAV